MKSKYKIMNNRIENKYKLLYYRTKSKYIFKKTSGYCYDHSSGIY